MYLVFACFWPRAPKTLGISDFESNKGVFYNVNEVNWESISGWRLVTRETNPLIRGLELSVPLPWFLGIGEGLVIESPVTNGLVNHAY